MRLDPQPWEWKGPRILIEHPDDARAAELADGFRRAGYAVAICPGPAQGERCPLVEGDRCAIAEGADAVVSVLGPAIQLALSDHLPRVPVVAPGSLPPAEVVQRVRLVLEREVDEVA